MTFGKGWEWRESSQRIYDWIEEQLAEAPHHWDKAADHEERELDPIAVMGLQDSRSDWVGAITSGKRRGMKPRPRPDLSRRHFITRAKSPVGNFFEKKLPDAPRHQQIQLFRHHVWSVWVQKGEIPINAEKWLRARAAEVNAGALIDLVSDSRFRSRKATGFLSKTTPYDCHGHVIRAMILIMAGKISKEQFFDVQAEYLLKMEGHPRLGDSLGKPAPKPQWVSADGNDLVTGEPFFE